MTPTRDSSILVSLLDQHGLAERGGKRNLQELSLNPISVVKYRGKCDKQGRYHGEGEAWYSNGSLYLGKFQHGVREGPGTLETTVAGVDHSLEGLFTQDRLEGWAEETYEGTGWRQAFYRKGQQVGASAGLLRRWASTGMWPPGTPAWSGALQEGPSGEYR